jgi:hypothetical protein
MEIMKKYLLLCCLILTALFTQAQSESTEAREFKNEIGIDLTLLLSNLFGWNQGYPIYDIYPYYYGYQVPNSYLFSYRRYFGNSALRFGAGADLQNSDTENNTGSYDAISKSMRADARIGYEFISRIGEHFRVFIGADIVTHSTKYESEIIYGDLNSDYSSSTSTLLVGGGPLIGLSWMITGRLKLSTEASLHFLTGNSETETIYMETPELNSTSTTKMDKLSANYPMFLNFEFLF